MVLLSVVQQTMFIDGQIGFSLRPYFPLLNSIQGFVFRALWGIEGNDATGNNLIRSKFHFCEASPPRDN